ncbi:MAG: hypothetical protein GWN46_27095, partial [Gammaproteobacteria bacterium]|nr:hypothetical protein [Gammaproteobacteria bacterium]
EIERHEDGYFHVVAKEIERDCEVTGEIKDLMSRLGGLFERYIKHSPGLPYETMLSTVRISDPGRLAD